MSRFEVPGGDAAYRIEEICTASTLTSLYNMLRGGENSDITIVCGDREFKAHRAIVCSQSLWFDVAFTTPAKVGEHCTILQQSATTDLTKQKRIIRKTEVTGVDPDVFQRFLEFLYTGTYTVEGDTPRRDLTKPRTAEIESLLKDYPGLHIPAIEEAASGTSKRPVRRSSRLESTAEPEPSDETPDAETNASPNSSLPSESLQAPYKAPYPPVMTMSLELYNLAFEYKVPALQLLARERFYKAAKARWLSSWEGASWEETKEFEDVVLDLYTFRDDQPMWKVLILLIKAKTEDDVMRRRMKEVLGEHYDLKSMNVV
ncbi:hypothetical protein FLAG1_08570 [Fusarium langsethiae]|uniref:BTB domain-containing protein n=1 Tax=Fusarium langsethiae TaxID=179993 RepID=A0A0N0DCR7_FUSLA|nr:hypothetical protein FLAG1_08570 [Fusarium langsethiae]GKU05682.1 unnamed protein product [Fusarium langsethiae]GKU21544.1 unnamed protein product [Fusarium langsethiae]